MDTQLSPANALRTRNTYMSYSSCVGYTATRLRSSQYLPSPLEYSMLVGKKVTTRLCRCQDHPSLSKYVNKERRGYAATQSTGVGFLRSRVAIFTLYVCSLRRPVFCILEGYSVVSPGITGKQCKHFKTFTFRCKAH